MNTRRGRSIAAVVLLAFVVACGAESPQASDPSGSPSTTDKVPRPSPTGPSPSATMSEEPSSETPMPGPGVRVVGGDSEFGTMLFDSTGQAIYLFDAEKTSTPSCYGDCAKAWPPVLTDGDPVAGDGVNAALLGSTRRTDGTTQVTYRDHPLYFYAHEGKREVKCHDVFMNGGNWYVVQPDGMAAPGA